MAMSSFAAGLTRLLHAMQRPACVWVACLWLALWLPPMSLAANPAPAVGAPEKRIALVIGNARYPAIPLNNPENDARVVASTLRRLGFEVQEHVNLPVKRFRQVVRDYVRRLQNESGVGLLYYAGHGVQIDGKNYLLPVDINLRDEEEIKDEAVDIDDLFLSKLSRAKTKGLIVVLDACRDNPFRGKTRNIQATGGLAEMGAPGAFFAYSAAPGATAEDGPENTNSVFTRHLAYEMLQPGQEIETTFKNVRVKVLRDTARRQMPWTNSSLTIDFQFNAQAAGAAAKAEAERQARIRALQDMLDRREAEQRQLEAQLQAMQRQLDQQSGGPAAVPAEPTATTAAPQGRIETHPSSATSSVPGQGLSRPAAAEAPATAPTAAPPPGPAPAALPAPPPESNPAVTTPPSRPPAQAPAVSPTLPPARREPTPTSTTTSTPAPATPAQTAQTTKSPVPVGSRTPPAAGGKRSYTERCVELQVRASLGEPVSMADIQRECKQ